MDHKRPKDDPSPLVREVLGYLNFSSGAPDPRFLENLNTLFGRLVAEKPGDQPVWRLLGEHLGQQLKAAQGSSDAFREIDQAEAVLELVFDGALPAYREFHGDLLFHQSDETLFQPFFIGRMCEAVLQQGGPWNERERIIPAAVRQLNDYIGHRPVAVLRTEQKIQPYKHEWVRPIPLWIRGAGGAFGPYNELIETALAILDATDSGILFDAMFTLDQLDELAFDPRAYDFDHPVNKRPNYLFGQWDMNRLDNAGRCRRFVLQQAALDAMLDRLERHPRLAHKEVLFEEAAVLAGTMLMGSGVSGNRPDAHDSTVTLASVVEKIAVYRDAFYEQLLKNLKGKHAERLRHEAVELRQPFGAARQHFNHFLARRRAEQLERVHLAQLFAAIGYSEGAARQVAVVPVASARMTCEMRCRMSAAHLAVERGDLGRAAAQLPPVEDLLHRAIGCGAMVDPWNILGFSGEYSLFPAIENTIHDHRVEELLDTMSDIFALYARIHKAAAAAGNDALQESLSRGLGSLAQWWDKFASVEVDSIEGVSGRAAIESADSVAAALRAWHQGGAAAGDLAFWRRHVEHFSSAKAYAQVVDTLLDHRDFVAAMALLVQWLSQAEKIPLVEEDYSFHDLALVWMEDLWEKPSESERSKGPAPSELWPLSKKFLDYLEANAEDYWQAPHFEMASEALGFDAWQHNGTADESEEMEDERSEDDEDNLFGAAYEDVTYRDSTDDGVEGDVFEGGENPAELELVGEAERIVGRLTFLTTVAQLWKLAATASFGENRDADRDDVLAGWLRQATRNHKQLLELMGAVYRHRVPPPRGTHESLIEYDRRRSVKETLLDEIVQACIETADAEAMIRASMTRRPTDAGEESWEQPAAETLYALVRGDADAVRKVLPELLRSLVTQPLLYVSLGRGGDPRRIVATRGRQYAIRRMLNYLPRLGLLSETCRLLEVAQLMESEHPVGPGAITEFDSIFEIGCKAMVECLTASCARRHDEDLVGYVEQVVEALLRCWLGHSRGVRLSVLEMVSDKDRWEQLKRFIESYGGDLFTQWFMNAGNLRGILHQGVDEYLETLRDEPDPDEHYRLIEDLDSAIPMDEAARWLGVAIEAVVENYGEYIDYNGITTQSDRGEMLYTLLDFMRLRTSYDRLAWNLRPVMLAHQVLVRAGRRGAAEIWQAAIAERTAPLADDHQKRFERLCKKYGMRLPSIAERISERFVRPLEIDRLCALIRPAVEEIRSAHPATAVRRLEQQAEEFTKEPPGAGYELPGWLEALDREMERSQWPPDENESSFDSHVRIPQVVLSKAEIERQIREMLGET